MPSSTNGGPLPPGVVVPADPTPGVVSGYAPTNPFIELGSTGLKRYSGYVVEEFLRVLQGRQAAVVYREMRENDAVVNAMLFAIEYLVRQVTWRVDAASADVGDQLRAQFVNSCLDDMNITWADLIAEVLSMLPYGWHWAEIVYKRRLAEDPDPTRRSRYGDGRIGWRKISTRAQDSLLHWEFDEEGGVQAMVQLAPPKFQIVTLPVEKSLLFRPTSWKGNPEGRSILRGAYRSWFLAKRVQEYEAIGLERDLAGYPVAQIKTDPTTGKALGPDIWTGTPDANALKDKIETFVRSVRRDEQEGAVLPHWLEFSLLSTGSRRQYDTTEIIGRYEQRIAMTVLADFILVGHEGTGSFSLHENKARLFGLALASFLDTIAEVFNRHAIPRLMALNGWGSERMPKLAHGAIDTPNLSELGAFIGQLSGAGMELFPEPELEAALMAAAKLPTRDKGEIAKAAGPAPAWAYHAERREFVRAVRELRQAVAASVVVRKEGNPNHDASTGEFSSGSGGGAGAIIGTHGTSSANLASILSTGLKGDKAGQAWPGTETGHVFLAHDHQTAVAFATYAAQHSAENATAVVLEVHVPASEKHRIVEDPAQTGKRTALKIKGDIPPEWIKRAWVADAAFVPSESPIGNVRWKEVKVGKADGDRPIYVALAVPSSPRPTSSMPVSE